MRVNPFASGLTAADLDVTIPAVPDGLVLPKCLGGADVQRLSANLAVREAEYDLVDGSTRVIAIAADSACALFAFASYRGASHRLEGLAWGGEDLAADLGAETNRLPDGGYCAPYALARTLTLVGAVAAEPRADRRCPCRLSRSRRLARRGARRSPRRLRRQDGDRSGAGLDHQRSVRCFTRGDRAGARNRRRFRGRPGRWSCRGRGRDARPAAPETGEAVARFG